MSRRPRDTARARRRVATAAVALCALAVLAGCGIPTASSPTPINRSDVPFRLLNPTPSPTTSPSTPSVTVSETIYLVDPTLHVTPVIREVAPPATLTEILGALMDGPTEAESSAGLQSFLIGVPSDVSATVANGVATVDFDTDPVQLAGPDQVLAIAQVVFTATQQPNVNGVLFQIAGQPIEVPTASGAQVPGPVTRAAYAPVAPVVPPTTTS